MGDASPDHLSGHPAEPAEAPPHCIARHHLDGRHADAGGPGCMHKPDRRMGRVGGTFVRALTARIDGLLTVSIHGPLECLGQFRHGREQIGHKAVVGDREDRRFFVPVSYTHLTLPTIYSV